MPLKPLPNSLVERLRKGFAKPERLQMLKRMENIDHRSGKLVRWMRAASEIEMPGKRVRQMDISRNYPQVKLALKVPHGTTERFVTAQETIDRVHGMVDIHNQRFKKETEYRLLKPYAYAITPKLIAMSKTDAPSVEEVLGGRKNQERTERGIRMLCLLKKRNGLQKEDIERIAQTLRLRTGILDGNMLLLGAEKGKLVFMPLVDYE